MMKTSVKRISMFLGTSMLVFGILKFIDPFKTWYHTQVVSSGLPLQDFSYWSGQLGEIIVGLLFLYTTLLPQSNQRTKWIFLTANMLTTVMMLVAVYVHIHPDVPHDVLPLKIKPPIIPLIFGVLPILNVYLEREAVFGKGQIAN
ncbi:hypothetical protein [Pontibacter sp. G13]|uniref:hypothetical protein n=1 Tax=Pontibacter sp. G13 TaxID=3074898 RepID=UPI0028897CAE|nr:hypothetical protein [Pontibacter sp. G13]WNJ17065.1 hypothetical protein RJD25_19600 [Pontibacter sp. G13]